MTTIGGLCIYIGSEIKDVNVSLLSLSLFGFFFLSLACAADNSSRPTLIFQDYPWNKINKTKHKNMNPTRHSKLGFPRSLSSLLLQFKPSLYKYHSSPTSFHSFTHSLTHLLAHYIFSNTIFAFLSLPLVNNIL